MSSPVCFIGFDEFQGVLEYSWNFRELQRALIGFRGFQGVSGGSMADSEEFKRSFQKSKGGSNGFQSNSKH